MTRGMTRMGLEVASAYRYIEEQPDFGPMTKAVLKGIVRKVAEAAISDVEDFVAEDCTCDPDVWGPDGLEAGDGHNPECPFSESHHESHATAGNAAGSGE